ncbi:phosphatase domain-containing protein [Nannocystis punicea]|uniref:Tyrosine-protein phosphatase n=1 Tax=Nannocystis punicea TaxID=2995304 RepID=A0ABY7H444_9BACT|nr:tyrosine-protein phosphatase [Nannocystis poenicansa]WAS94046.1 tyrosine-protein phosphatase [Nannocystis poenicansa]
MYAAYVFVFAAYAAMLLAPAVWFGGWTWLLAWPALSFALVAAAYAGLGARMFGKRSDGTIAPLHRLALLPFHGLVAAVWHGLRLSRREPAWCELVPGVLIGRRLLPRELPANVELIIDLTAEFPEPPGVRSAAAYRSLPTLDAGRAAPAEFRALVEEVAASSQTVFIHCAQGHGRTGTFAAAVLIVRGLATDPAEALAMLQRVRPGIRLKPAQLRALAAFEPRPPR